ncbi:MAG: 4Fe-4S binding protein [Candidatus Hodarchaeota archaeon]
MQNGCLKKPPGICPSHCLILEKGVAKPEIRNKCQGCAYCERQCPQRAISFKHKRLPVVFTKLWGNLVYQKIPDANFQKRRLLSYLLRNTQ